ncbi:MAG: sulfite exporter TauE/SafE family protein [Ketobacteraceae bacterium]|nr:sulfite exporter TauE/SafE family protein [Ketobacteraceae bacterium]
MMGEQAGLTDLLLFACLAVTGVLLTGISKSGFAGGAGVVAVPMLALVMPASQAAALMLPILILMDGRTVYLYRRSVRWSELKTLLPAAIAGIALGGLLMGWLSDAGLSLLLGAVSLIFASWQRMAPRLMAFRGSAWIWGGLSGITSTLIHAGGPPLNIYLLGRQLPKPLWLATAAVFFAVMNLIKIVPYTLVGAWQGVPWLLMLALIPFAYLGVGLGYRIQHRLSEAAFISLCRLLLGTTGLLLMAKPVWSGLM